MRYDLSYCTFTLHPNIIIFKVGNNIRIKMNALWIWWCKEFDSQTINTHFCYQRFNKWEVWFLCWFIGRFFFNLVLLAIHGLIDYTTMMVKEFISFHQQFKKFVIEKWFYESWPPNIHAKRPWQGLTFQHCVTRRALPKRF